MRSVTAGALTNLVVVCLLGSSAAAAQDGLVLRFVPADDAPVAIQFQTVASAAGSNGKHYEFADLGLMTGVLVGTRDDVRVFHLTHDSIRVRAREEAGPWREFVPPVGDSAWMQVRVDDRLTVLGLTGRGLPGFTDPVGVLTGVRGLALPEGSVGIGESWQARTAVPLPAGPGGSSVESSLALVAETAVTLDSIAIRAHDTLGYLSIAGIVEPMTVVDPLGRDRAQWSFSGEVSGALIWSTGWKSFVAGTHRARVHARRQNGSGPDAVHDTLGWEMTTRYRVRP